MTDRFNNIYTVNKKLTTNLNPIDYWKCSVV